jgi:hypothetical protein
MPLVTLATTRPVSERIPPIFHAEFSADLPGMVGMPSRQHSDDSKSKSLMYLSFAEGALAFANG